MSLTFFFLVFFIFIVQYSIYKKIYFFDKPKFKTSKIINIIWCFLLILYVSMQTDNVRTLIMGFESFKTKYLIDVGFINHWIILLNKIIQIIINFYMIVIVFHLMRRNMKFRKRILYIIPIMFLVETIDSYRVIYLGFIEQLTMLSIVLYSLSISIIAFIPLFITYNSKTFTQMMVFDNEKIKDIILNK